MHIYAAILKENHALREINLEKSMNFADFRQLRLIFTQPIVKKGTNIADFRQSKLTIMQPISKKKREFSRILII